MKLSGHSITLKLLLLFLVVGISSLLITGSFSFYAARRAIMNRTVDQLISVRAVKKQQVEYLFEVKIKNLRNLSANENLGRIFSGNFQSPHRDDNLSAKKRSIRIQALEPDYEHKQANLKDIYTAYGYSNLYLFFNQRLILVADSEEINMVSDTLLNRILLIGSRASHGQGVAVSDLFFKKPGDSVPEFLIGTVLKTADAADQVIVIAEVSAGELNKIMLQDNGHTGLGKTGEAYIVGNDLLMRSPSRFISHSSLRVPARTESVVKAMAGDTGAFITDDYRGIRVFSAFEPLVIPGLKWVILAEIDYEEAMIPVTGLRNDILFVSFVIMVLILGFSKVITRMVTQPIISLKDAAAGLGSGNFDKKVAIRSGDEIGMLANTFNTMLDQLKAERSNRLTALYDGQEIERKRISRELHDGLGQKLVGTKLQIENCDESDQTCLKKTLAEAKFQLHAIVEELHRISNDLMPAALNELGLETALQNLCNDFGQQAGIDVEFETTLLDNPNDKTAVYLYRICQEGLQNIIKHSGADRASLHLLETRDLMLLIIEDNGSGFDPSGFLPGNGLANMRERSALLGATFSIESAPGHGTTIRIKIPKVR